jgi:hypothetical protein
MANPPMNNDGMPVTRAQLREELARYPTREELKAELSRFATKDELGQLVQTVAEQHDVLVAKHDVLVAKHDTLTAKHDTLAAKHDTLAERLDTLAERLDQFIQLSAERHEELLREIAGSARAAAEEHRRELGVLDDRYRDLPARVTTLEGELDEHRRDGALHSPPRRPRRQR